ncbi:MAG: glycosyltransferase [Candidatus Pacearchaeota archaeon]
MKNLSKVNKIMYVGVCNKYYWHYQNVYKVLEKMCNYFIPFDYRDYNLKYGKDKMNEMFLEIVKKEKPNIIFFILHHDEFYLNTFLKIRQISPDSITMNFFSDDDVLYDVFSRYYSLFIDFPILAQKYENYYKKDGYNNVIFMVVVNPDFFKPLHIKKKYDVTFIGAPKFNRYSLIKYLLDNGIHVKIFGRGWHNYPELKKQYMGSLTDTEMIKVINQTKINLCFSRNENGDFHLKGRVFEIAACKSFMIVENFEGYLDFFKKNKEIVMFKTKEDLLEKIRYYLKYDSKRKEIENRAYNKIIKKYNFFLELENFFKKIKNKKISHPSFLKLNKKIIELNKKDFLLSNSEIIEKIKKSDFISFNNGIINKDPYKEYLQIYSLIKSKKDISCCNCYINHKKLGNYLYFLTNVTFNTNKNDFYNLVDISQLAVTKNFFIKNINLFRDIFNGKKIDFIKDSNTTFIIIPLIELSKVNFIEFKKMKRYFIFNYLYKLYSLFYQKKIFFDPFLYNIFFESIKGNFFFIWGIMDAIKDKQYIDKLKELKEQEIYDKNLGN